MFEIIEVFQMEFMQRAVAAGLLVALLCPTVGIFIVMRRLSLIVDGLGHISFAGIGIGLLLNWQPLFAAIVTTALGALGIEHLRGTRQAASDVAIAVFSAVGLATGAILISMGGGTDIFGFLFGSLVAVHPFDLWLITGLGLLVLILIAFCYKGLVAVTIDEEVAAAAGLPVRMLNSLIVLATAITTVAAIRVVGILLVSCLFVLPVATSMRLCRGFSKTLVVAVLIGVLNVFSGLLAAFWFDLPTGGTIVILLALSFFASSLWSTYQSKLFVTSQTNGG